MSTAVSVGLVDSGVNVPHPHLPTVAGGVGLDFEGRDAGDHVDRLGHGTAVAAVIHEKCPGAAIWAIKVFDRELATTVRALGCAVDWASERGIRLVNLSLGTPNEFREPELAPAIARATERGTIVVSAFEHGGRRWYPGCMSGALGVVMDPDQPREVVSVTEIAGVPVISASPYPRPIPGVPLEKNFHGISFAVANATGVLARLLAEQPDARSAREALELVRGGSRSEASGRLRT